MENLCLANNITFKRYTVVKFYIKEAELHVPCLLTNSSLGFCTVASEIESLASTIEDARLRLESQSKQHTDDLRSMQEHMADLINQKHTETRQELHSHRSELDSELDLERGKRI